MSIAQYFVTPHKRPLSSDSSECDTPQKDKQINKRPHITDTFEEETDVDTDHEELDMSVQELLSDMNKRLDHLATKDDISEMKRELQLLTQTFTDKIEKLDGRVFETEAKTEEMEKKMYKLKKENDSLKNMLHAHEQQMRKMQKEQNDQQQYSRRWNLRVFKVPEGDGETADDCRKKCCDIFNQKANVKTAVTDMEVAHRTGTPTGTKSRPILVRFFDRKLRDHYYNRRKLKNKGIVIGEDLTFANHKVYMAAVKHSACSSAWTVNGKIFAKLTNGTKMKLDMHTDVDRAFRRVMGGRQPEVQVEETDRMEEA